jgi:hypothetical protein
MPEDKSSAQNAPRRSSVKTDGSVVPHPSSAPPEPPAPPSRPGRLHGLAIAGMAISALIGIISMLTFITVSWPAGPGRVILFVCIVSGLGFLAFASVAVLAAARDTYAPTSSQSDD